jgi:hypothetical protein
VGLVLQLHRFCSREFYFCGERDMKNKFFIPSSNKSSVGLLIIALVIGGISAQAAGLLNSPAGGYLVCVNPKTKVVTHPGKSTCPKGSKKLVLGARGVAGADGITGAAGIAGKDGANGKDGKTLWNGVKDPESTLGAPGDIFINSVTKTLFGPKDLATGWPAGVSMVGPTGATGAPGSNGGSGPAGATGQAGSNGINGTDATLKITELSLCDGVDDGTVADEICKVGMRGPGGGIIFFVDYNDQYTGFNYLEAAPSELPTTLTWSNNTSTSVPRAYGWAARAVGRGQTNTTAIVALPSTSGAAFSADAYVSPTFNGGTKSDWFLGSLGEMKLMYDNLQGLGGLADVKYWSSTEVLSVGAWFQDFGRGDQVTDSKSATYYVRPVRAF